MDAYAKNLDACARRWTAAVLAELIPGAKMDGGQAGGGIGALVLPNDIDPNEVEGILEAAGVGGATSVLSAVVTTLPGKTSPRAWGKALAGVVLDAEAGKFEAGSMADLVRSSRGTLHAQALLSPERGSVLHRAVSLAPPPGSRAATSTEAFLSAVRGFVRHSGDVQAVLLFTYGEDGIIRVVYQDHDIERSLSSADLTWRRPGDPAGWFPTNVMTNSKATEVPDIE